MTLLISVFCTSQSVSAQDNSPYSRYGIGDLVPSTNITTRGMGGITAAYADMLTINFNNPASYASFFAIRESKTKKLSSGRAILDIGVNMDSRTLREKSTNAKFVASNALFSYVQVGLPIKKDWGVSFGLRPVSRISYNMFRTERLKDPLTGLPIDSAYTTFTGDGGSYLVSMGTGFSVFSKVYTDSAKNGMEEKLSIGFNAGYMFGKKDYSTRRSLINDTVEYNSANYETKTTFGNIYLNAGIQYARPLKNKMMLTVGAFGTLGQKMNAKQDVLRETYLFDATLGNVRLDSVSDTKDVAGKIEIPASITVGFILQKFAVLNKEGGWLFGVDFNMQNWGNYRYYGQRDSVKNKWEIKAGGEFRPVPKRNYFSNVTYRFGVFGGPDYIKVGNQKLGVLGGSFGLGLPLKYSRQAPNQNTLINLAFEYGKRGNSNNILRENLFRFSVGFSLSDIWFIKRKYD
ncbi:MAG: hypothetical protein NTW29_12930 [Bacteroidetes bacterium]|nr:hypothetical protein [Bacteroidota bacterium]